MVTKWDRRLIKLMIKVRLWGTIVRMRNLDICEPIFGTAWLLKRMRKRQVVDDLHHAPACPANHYHKTRLVFQLCNCGAQIAHDHDNFIAKMEETS